MCYIMKCEWLSEANYFVAMKASLKLVYIYMY